jgi:hypothetical protein
VVNSAVWDLDLWPERYFGLTVDVPESYTRKLFLSQNKFLSMYVYKATIQDYKKNISKILSFFLIFENFFSENDGLFEQNLNFSLFYQNLIKTIFFKNSKRWVRKGLNQQKMARDIDFRAPGGRESL